MMHPPRATSLQHRSVYLWALLILVAGLFWITPSTVLASTAFESISNIRQKVQQFVDGYDFGVSHRVSSSVGQIDTRLRLHRCELPLNIYFTSDNIRPGRNFLGVRCESDKPWNIFLSARVEMFADVLVSKNALLRGDSISKEQVTFETRKLTTLRAGYFINPEQLENMQVTRVVRAGQVITPALLKPRYLVKRGEAVTLVATTGGISVKMKGKALGDATSNGRVRVKNNSSGRIVEGLVIQQGLVKIPM